MKLGISINLATYTVNEAIKEVLRMDQMNEAKYLLVKHCHMSEKEAMYYILRTAQNAKVTKEIIISQILHIYR